ncbi:hypothetical protein LEP1GSC127_0084 [Leptospira kirschneri str. 200801925]|nr:hypothetical protein LEP1GSC127_0084 [Leptospira kirschneri str. 200801925]
MGNLPLKVSPNSSAKLKKLLFDYYGYPKEEPSSWILAKRIDTLIRDKKKIISLLISLDLKTMLDLVTMCCNI